MLKRSYLHFFESIRRSKTEEDVKNAYAKHFDISYDTSDRLDLYTSGVLFEFKYDKNLKSLRMRSQVLAQTLYYVRQLKYGSDCDKPIPPVLCLADVNEAAITETALWQNYYDDRDEKYDWDLTPSSPDAKLVNDIEASQLARDLHVYDITIEPEFTVFADLLSRHLDRQIPLAICDKKVITEDNFYAFGQ